MFAYIPCLIKFTEHDFPLALAKFNSIEYVFCNQISLHRLAAGKEIVNASLAQRSQDFCYIKTALAFQFIRLI